MHLNPKALPELRSLMKSHFQFLYLFEPFTCARGLVPFSTVLSNAHPMTSLRNIN